VPPSVLELNNNLTTLVDTCKLINIKNNLTTENNGSFLVMEVKKKQPGNLNLAFEQAALRVLSVNKNILI